MNTKARKKCWKCNNCGVRAISMLQGYANLDITQAVALIQKGSEE
jgi:hypothetical protein